MKHGYTITFNGEVDENQSDIKESLKDILELIQESFQPDLVSGVSVTGMDIHTWQIAPLINTRGER